VRDVAVDGVLEIVVCAGVATTGTVIGTSATSIFGEGASEGFSNCGGVVSDGVYAGVGVVGVVDVVVVSNDWGVSGLVSDTDGVGAAGVVVWSKPEVSEVCFSASLDEDGAVDASGAGVSPIFGASSVVELLETSFPVVFDASSTASVVVCGETSRFSSKGFVVATRSPLVAGDDSTGAVEAVDSSDNSVFGLVVAEVASTSLSVESEGVDGADVDSVVLLSSWNFS